MGSLETLNSNSSSPRKRGSSDFPQTTLDSRFRGNDKAIFPQQGSEANGMRYRMAARPSLVSATYSGWMFRARATAVQLLTCSSVSFLISSRLALNGRMPAFSAMPG